MATTTTKNILINVKADTKQLEKNLGKIPDITKKESKQLVQVLTTELKQAEISAKKTAQATGAGMKKIEVSSKKASINVKKLRKETGQLGGGLQAMGDIVGEIDPALGGVAMTVSIVGIAVRDLGKALLQSSPIMLGVIGTVTALGAVYAIFANESEKVAKVQKNIRESIDNANKAMEIQAQTANEAQRAIISVNEQIEALETEYQLLIGAVTQLDVELQKAQKTQDNELETLINKNAVANEGYKQAIDAQSRTVTAFKKSISLLREQTGLTEENLKKTDGYKHRLNNLERAQKKLLDLENEQKEFQKESKIIIQETTLELGKQQRTVIKTKDQQRKNLELQRQRAEAARALAAEEAERTRKNQANIQKEQAEIAKYLTILDNFKNARIAHDNELISITEQNQRLRIQFFDDQIAKSKANLELELAGIERIIQAKENEQLANLKLATSDELKNEALQNNLLIEQEISLLKEQMHLKEAAALVEQSKLRKKNTVETKLQADEIANYYITGANALSELIKTASNENKEAALVAFRVSQAAAIAQIAINTAEQISKVAANPLAIAGVSAIGAMQAATVLAQPAPEFHTGGIIKGDDTQTITALTGEAILDRRTVNRLGGENGLNQLRRTGNNNNEVIILQPFKHFDRFVTANSRNGGEIAKIKRRKAAGKY